jgi:hypothetical protein
MTHRPGTGSNPPGALPNFLPLFAPCCALFAGALGVAQASQSRFFFWMISDLSNLRRSTDLSGQSETFGRSLACSLPVAPTHRETALVRCPEAPRSGPGRSGGQQSALAGAVTGSVSPRAQ